MSEHDCPLTPAQRAAYHEWKVREVLRRREAGRGKASLGAAAVESLERRPGPRPKPAPSPDGPRQCPRCGKPYGKRARCYACRPGGGFGKGSR